MIPKVVTVRLFVSDGRAKNTLDIIKHLCREEGLLIISTEVDEASRDDVEMAESLGVDFDPEYFGPSGCEETDSDAPDGSGWYPGKSWDDEDNYNEERN